MSQIDVHAYGLSIDPNTKRTGMCGWLGKQPTGTRTVRSSDGWLEMAQRIDELLTHSCPDWCAVEGVYKKPDASIQSVLKLAYLVGAIQATCRRLAVPCFVLTTAEIDAATGIQYGKGKRKHANRALAEYLDLNPANLDEADAVAVGFAGYARFFEHQLRETA